MYIYRIYQYLYYSSNNKYKNIFKNKKYVRYFWRFISSALLENNKVLINLNEKI